MTEDVKSVIDFTPEGQKFVSSMEKVAGLQDVNRMIQENLDSNAESSDEGLGNLDSDEDEKLDPGELHDFFSRLEDRDDIPMSENFADPITTNTLNFENIGTMPGPSRRGTGPQVSSNIYMNGY